MRTCAYVECGLPFEAKTHNQRYCCDECCRRATNIRLAELYREKRARIKGYIRVCETSGCETRLSRYNEGRVCQKCEAEKVVNERLSLLKMIGMNE